MTDDDGDDDTMEGRLAHILESDAMDTVDLWLTIVACLAAIETLYVCALATYRYSRRVYHLHSNGGRSARFAGRAGLLRIDVGGAVVPVPGLLSGRAAGFL